MIELILPIVYTLTFLATLGAFTSKDTLLDKYYRSQEFYVFFLYLGVLPLLFVSFSRFINFQVPREQEIKVSTTFKIMNVSLVATEVSLFLT